MWQAEMEQVRLEAMGHSQQCRGSMKVITLLGEARRDTEGTRRLREASWKAVRKSGEGVGDRTVILTVESERAE